MTPSLCPGRVRRSALRVVVLFQGCRSSRPLASWLRRQFIRAARRSHITAGQATLVVASDREMARLHRRHKGVSGTTDVLTFDLRPEEQRSRDAIDADIVLCMDEARRQATVRGHALRLELLLYAVHGLLHLSGYDDHTARAAAAMHRREDQLLTALGLGPVYAPPPLPTSGGGRGRRSASFAG